MDSEDQEESSEDELPAVITKKSQQKSKLDPVDLNQIFSKYPDQDKIAMLEKQQKLSDEKIATLEAINKTLAFDLQQK